MPLLRNGEHWIELKTVDQIRPTVRLLRANASWAKAMAQAGRRFALEQLNHRRVMQYFATMITRVPLDNPSADSAAQLVQQQNYTAVTSESDLWRLAKFRERDHPRCLASTLASRAVGGFESRSHAWRCCVGHNCPGAFEKTCAGRNL